MASRVRMRADQPAADLDEYHARRDFDRTPEPYGATAAAQDQRRFVIQQHDATRLHWDLRLEYEGVAASWALPRGLPREPLENHLAVHTEDHPIEYLDYEGDIPDGSYGAGHMHVWDRGTYEAHEWRDDKVVVTLHGARAGGRHALFTLRGRDWLIHRMDPPADPSWEPPDPSWRPMRATPERLPVRRGWAYEARWSGLRVLVSNRPGVATITDASGQVVTSAFPDVRRIERALGAVAVVLDGVITTAGEPTERLRRRLAAKSASTIRRLATDTPAVFVALDVLWLDGRPLLRHPWLDRRAMLEELGLDGPAWRTAAVHSGSAHDVVEAARAAGVRLVAKRTRSTYEPDATSADWIEAGASSAAG